MKTILFMIINNFGNDYQSFGANNTPPIDNVNKNMICRTIK